ncbi:hypothetical protein L226DRAFT_242604 [Lentinus tigrinus ALCF2SS1-7]|uniref:uncharacterized protein n=1 Tax=Lentinus tigrinus ALCF2SS1-7 TaxID=1328758 RepID=UPI00116610C9|nr:hypothetical protein L226DRAFT_242604 [Lentinus tigrinus ALCF2SS1-7]
MHVSRFFSCYCAFVLGTCAWLVSIGRYACLLTPLYPFLLHLLRDVNRHFRGRSFPSLQLTTASLPSRPCRASSRSLPQIHPCYSDWHRLASRIRTYASPYPVLRVSHHPTWTLPPNCIVGRSVPVSSRLRLKVSAGSHPPLPYTHIHTSTSGS